MGTNVCLPLKLHRIWMAVAEEDRVQTCRNFLLIEEIEPRLAALALDSMTAFLHMRHESVLAMSVEERALTLARAPRLSSELARILLHLLHVDRLKMLKVFYDELGLRHDKGVVDAAVLKGFHPPPDLVERAVEAISSRFPPEHVQVHLHFLLARAPEAWGFVRPHVRLPLAAPAPQPLAEAPEQSDEFTSLDNLLIRIAVDSVQGTLGALSRGRLDDVVEEVIRLNADRQHSYFHRGFVQALHGEPLSMDFPESSESRRRWYAAGAILGHARRREAEPIVGLLDQDREVWESFRDPADSLSRTVAPHVFFALCRRQLYARAAEFVTPEMGAALEADFLQHVLDEAVRLVGERRVEDAAPLLGLAHAAVEAMEEAGDEAPAALRREVSRRRAQCALLQGNLDEARQILEETLSSSSPEGKSDARVYLGLIACGLASAAEVRIPADEGDVASFLKKLDPGETHFRRALEDAPPRSRAQYCEGAIAVSRRDWEKAVACLRPAVPEIANQPQVAPVPTLLARAKFYLGCALSARMDPLDGPFAASLLSEGLADAEPRPAWLLRVALEGLRLVDEDAAVALARPIAAAGGAYLDGLIASGLAERSPIAREAVRTRASDESLPREARFRDWRHVARAALSANQPAEACEALDRMEALAEEGACRAEFLAMLEERRSWDPAWTDGEARWARVRLLEREGRLDDAAGLLLQEFHELASRGEDGALDDAADVLETLRSYGVGEFPSERARLEAVRAAARPAVPSRPAASSTPTASAAARRVVVLFVGGDEMEARNDAEVRTSLARDLPRIDVDFVHPGWGGNWGRSLAALRPKVDRADCLVLSRYIRTMLGRALRATEKPWVACTGRGRRAVEASLRRAADVAAGIP
ncbi:MAG: hypothetical protein AAB434_10185 [Planctomycetota bacterium]